MAKKNADKADEAAVDPRAPIETEWRGTVRWACPFCAFDSPDQARVERHIATAHPEPGVTLQDALAAQNAPAQPANEPANEQPAETPEKGEGD
jgi:hypothetical protein